MKIEVLYFEGCPNHVPAIEVLRETLNSLGYEEEIHEVEVHTQAEAEDDQQHARYLARRVLVDDDR